MWAASNAARRGGGKIGQNGSGARRSTTPTGSLPLRVKPEPGERMTFPAADSALQLDGIDIELGPHLPMAAYHAMEQWHAERIGALALYGSDGRWGEAFDEFCHRHLQIPRYDRWAVPGGPAWVAAPPGDHALVQVRLQLDFLVRAHEL